MSKMDNRNEKHKPVLSVRVDQKLLEWLDHMCERTGVGRADVVERCLSVGLAYEEQMVQWLEAPIHGPTAILLSFPGLARALVKLTGGEVDEVEMKIRENVL